MPISAGLYYAEQKSDTGRFPVVLIHGAGGSHLHWPPELRRLPGQAVYALDLPGHGKSEGLGQQSVEGYAQAVLEWLESMQIDIAVLTGHSMGGAICQHLGVHHPEKCGGLVLIGTGARLRVLPSILENSAGALTYPRAVEEIIQRSYSDSADPRLLELGREALLDVRPTVLHGDYLACNDFDLMGEIETLQPPTLVITGTEDQLTPPRYAQYLANKIPNARLVLVPQAGHMVMLEQPRQTASSMLAFLTRLN